MNKIVLILLTAALVTACSKTAPDTQAAAQAMPVNHKKICERMVALAPPARKESFTQISCEASYQQMMPACRNAAAVNDCFTNMKAWEERLACMDSCVRDAGAEKK